MQCPSCSQEVTEILAHHDYTIELDASTGNWHKNENGVVYSCSNCLEELNLHDIEDVLKQVDEL